MLSEHSTIHRSHFITLLYARTITAATAAPPTTTRYDAALLLYLAQGLCNTHLGFEPSFLFCFFLFFLSFLFKSTGTSEPKLSRLLQNSYNRTPLRSSRMEPLHVIQDRIRCADGPSQKQLHVLERAALL